jgi:hypothetical protein
VLARLDGDAHDPAMKSWWNLEAGFGPCQAIGDNLFQTLNDAETWVRQKVAAHSSARAQSVTAVQQGAPSHARGTATRLRVGAV